MTGEEAKRAGRGVADAAKAAAVGLAFVVAFCGLLLCRSAAAFEPSILDTVVSVIPDWPGYPRTTEAPGAPEYPEGTATAIFPGGYPVTNVHVLGAAETVRVRLSGSAVHEAAIVGKDGATDLALLRVPVDLPVPETAPPPQLGGRVCAIGNQFGLGPSLTCGVVSATGVSGTGFNPIEDFIQTDAAGRLVGVVSAIFTKKSDANIGINFAASMRLVHRVAEDLRDHGRVVCGRQGFGVFAGRPPGRTGPAGAVVAWVEPGSSAEAAGLKKGDRVLSIGGRAIRRPTDAIAAVHMFRPGEAIDIELADGETRKTVTVILAE